MKRLLICSLFIALLLGCSEDIESPGSSNSSGTGDISDVTDIENNNGESDGSADKRIILDGRIDFDALDNYANQAVPGYINKDNTRANTISDIEATLGRVLFYDKKLSVDGTVSCASCHKQEFAFGDNEIQSQGVNSLTGRHSMRLVNARFSLEEKFFWDERAANLEEQTTMPIRDHGEMGFSGEGGDPAFNVLLERLSGVDYYQALFAEAYGDNLITENRIQNALAQFIRSIQSFDSRYDAGRSQARNDNDNFLNFTAQENRGKQLFMRPPQFQGQSGIRIGGGLGCNGCHNAPEFDIDPNSRNNGITGVAGMLSGTDTSVTRSPSLRDLFSSTGEPNTPFMHTGEFSSINEVIDHYNMIERQPENRMLDERLARGGGVRLNITDNEREDLIAFLKTLSGNQVYHEEKWSNPFE